MGNREILIARVVADVSAAAATAGIAAASCFVDRDVPIKEQLLPAINLRRASDVGGSSGQYRNVRRTLALAVDIYAQGDTRGAVLDAIERATRVAIDEIGDALAFVLGSDLDVNWDVDDLAVQYMAARMHISIEYKEPRS